MINIKSVHCLLILGCLLIYLPLNADGLRIAKKYNTGTAFITLADRFGFQTGGTVAISGSHSGTREADGFVYVCNQHGHRSLFSDPRARENICSDPNSRILKDCLLSPLNNEESHHVITQTDMYSFLIVNCYKDTKNMYGPLQVDLRLLALNPIGSHISYGLTPVPHIYVGLAVLWSIFASAWVACLFLYRRNFNFIHRSYMGIIFAKTIIVFLALIFWKVYQNHGRVFNPLMHTKSLATTLFEALFFCILLLFSKGWGVSRESLPPQEFRSVSMPLFLLLFTLIFFSVYNDGYYMIAMMIMYFLMMPKIYTSISENIRILGIHQWLAQNFQLGQIPLDAIVTKIRFFKRLRIFATSYVVVVLLSNCVRIFVSWRLEWIAIFFQEFIALIMLAILAFMIRPQSSALFSTDQDIFIEEIEDLSESLAQISQLRSFHKTLDVNSMVVVKWPNKRGLSVAVRETRKDRKE